MIAAVALVNADGSGGEHLQALEAHATTLSLDEFFVNVRKYRSVVAEIDRIVAQGEAFFNSVVTRLARRRHPPQGALIRSYIRHR